MALGASGVETVSRIFICVVPPGFNVVCGPTQGLRPGLFICRPCGARASFDLRFPAFPCRAFTCRHFAANCVSVVPTGLARALRLPRAYTLGRPTTNDQRPTTNDRS